jgi:hypothetical protein
MCRPGAWYDLLIKYGAGSELQRLNQLSTTLKPGVFNNAGYVLTGQGGPRGGSNVPLPAYELATITQAATILAMSWLPTASGQPPYSLIDEFTVNTQIKTTRATAGSKAKAKKKAALSQSVRRREFQQAASQRPELSQGEAVRAQQQPR